MATYEQVSAEPIRKLLRMVSLNRAGELDALFNDLAPVCELDRTTERNLFQAILAEPNIIRIGVKCTVRLQAHAYAAGVVCAAIGTTGFAQLDTTQREPLFAPANDLFTWAVGLDLQRWLAGFGLKINPEQVLPGGTRELPSDVLSSLTPQQRIFGEGIFRYACAFILLHELGHLKYRHTVSTPEFERVADRFAAEWLSDAAHDSSGDVESDRLCALFGIAVALLWLTTFNFFLGKMNKETHPEGYDRLYRTLEDVIDASNEDEREVVWYFVFNLLFIHMWSAGFDFDPQHDAGHLQGDMRDQVNYLIDRIANGDRKR